MSNIAYGLRAEYDGTVEQDGETVPVYTGGIIAVDGHDFDVRAELDAGNGSIVVDESNAPLIRALDEYPALKRVATPEDGEPISRWDGESVSELRAELKVRDLPSSGNRDELVARLEASDAHIADPAHNPDPAAPPAPTAPDPSAPSPAADPDTEN
jgi:hypothetical protein